MNFATFALIMVRSHALSYHSTPSKHYANVSPGDSNMPQYMRGYFSNELGPNYEAIRLTVLCLILLCMASLGFMIVYGVSKFMSAPRRSRDKFAFYVEKSYMWTQRGRSKRCIKENGCSGGTTDGSKAGNPGDRSEPCFH